MPDYLPIAEHGIIGDLHTVALAATDGTIDWYCCPTFDSPSVFASILDKDKGGHYPHLAGHGGVDAEAALLPGHERPHHALPQPGRGGRGRGLHADRGVDEDPDAGSSAGSRVCAARCASGSTCEPRFDYGRAQHEVEQYEHGVVFRSPSLCLALQATTPIACDATGIHCEFTVRAGSSVTFVLERVEPDYVPRAYSEAETRAAFEQTIAFWRSWVGRSHYRGRWREMVNRSALTLKLLTYAPTGAIVAAPTTSLPEEIGGRAQLGLPVHVDPRRGVHRSTRCSRIGFTDEAEAFMDWLRDRVHASRAEHGPLQIMYGIDGRSDLTEETSTTSRATAAPRRYESATARTTSSSSTSTAS